MCMMLAVALPNVALVATDTRTNTTLRVGGRTEVRHSDLPNKLHHLPVGFVGFSGDRLMADVGIAALRQLPADADLDAIAAAVQGAYEREAHSIRTVTPDANPERTAFFVARPRGDVYSVAEVWPNRPARDHGSSAFIVSWPPEVADPTSRNARLGALISGARTLAELLAVIGGVFREVSAHSPSMSSEVHLGIIGPGTEVLVQAADLATDPGAALQRLQPTKVVR